MTPFELEILIHYKCFSDDCRACIDNVSIWAETRDAMLRDELLAVTYREGRTYKLGERGEAFIDHILSLPLPHKKITWAMP